MDSSNLSKAPLEPDFIAEGDKVLYMSDSEQKRRVAVGWAEVAAFLLSEFRRGL